jgi:hypothetical protein
MKLKIKYKGIEKEYVYIPDWQKNLVRQRLEEYRNNPDAATNFDSAMDDLEELEDIKLYDEAKKGKQEFIDAEQAFREIEEARKK